MGFGGGALNPQSHSRCACGAGRSERVERVLKGSLVRCYARANLDTGDISGGGHAGRYQTWSRPQWSTTRRGDFGQNVRGASCHPVIWQVPQNRTGRHQVRAGRSWAAGNTSKWMWPVSSAHTTCPDQPSSSRLQASNNAGVRGRSSATTQTCWGQGFGPGWPASRSPRFPNSQWLRDDTRSR